MLYIKKWALLAFFSFCLTPLFAQKKPLTEKHYFENNRAGIQKNPAELAVFGEWKDKTHFSLRTPEGYYLVNAKNGSKKAIESSDYKTSTVVPSVRIKEKDIFFMDGSTEIRLTNDSLEEVNPTLSGDKQYVAFTKNNDLYTIHIPTKKQTRLTHDGSDLILNGYASWVYMEEILGRAGRYRAFWWSPDSKSLVYYKFDDTQVPEFIITDAPGLHGVVEKTRYPKVGDPNPEVKIGVVPAQGGNTVWMDFNEKEDQYFGEPFWESDKLLIPWMNRLQNHLVVYEMNPVSGTKKTFYTETQETWIDLSDKNRFHFVNNGKNVLLMSDKSGWMHIYNYDLNGNLINPVTSGEFTVTNINFIDAKNSIIYFSAKGKENTARTDVYRVNFNGKQLKRLSFGEYTHRAYNFSPDGKYFLTQFENHTTPPVVALMDHQGKKIMELSDLKADDFDTYELADIDLVRVKSKDGLYELPMKVTWPLKIEPGKKYPVLVSIYGGPGSTSVMDNWRFSGSEQFYAKEGLIQVVMDHRGSGHFGKKGMNFMYHNLGYWEMEDYGTMVEWLITNGNADPKRIAITGFSYGGYLSSYALTYGADIFTHAMAGGSVIDWTLYDTHYTERFMGTPANNPDGYKSSSVLTHIDKFKGKLQLVHGSIDDNVHLQNSIWLATALQNRKKDFDMMFYSGQRHGIRGAQGEHFQNLKTKFIYEHLLEKPVEERMLR